MMTDLATFGNLLGPDVLVVFALMLLFFGAKKLPELARGLGQSLNEFRKAREDFEHELHSATPTTPTVNPREAQNRQPFNAPASVPATELELRRQLEEAQAALRAVQQQKSAPQLMEPAAPLIVEGHDATVHSNQPS